MLSGQNVCYCSKLHMVALPEIGLFLIFFFSSQTLCETFLTLCGSYEHYHSICNLYILFKECYSSSVNHVLHWCSVSFTSLCSNSKQIKMCSQGQYLLSVPDLVEFLVFIQK